jgi:purine nucleosidase
LAVVEPGSTLRRGALAPPTEGEATVHQIILDTDVAMGAPGPDIDDGFAMALGVDLHDQSLELITNDNTDVETSTLLPLDILGPLGRPHNPAVKGAVAPLLRPVHEYLARDRVAGVRERLADRTPTPGRAAMASIDHVLANLGEISLVAIGPPTNVAVALALEPALSSAVKEIFVMGGAQTGLPGGNRG